MLPDIVLSSEVIQSSFLYPDNLPHKRLTDYEMGGIALQDPSQGLQYQPWFGYWSADTDEASLRPNIDGAPIVIFSESDVVEFAFTFDQNMRWVAATISSTGLLKFRWYDATVPGYVTTTYANIYSVKLGLDDKRAVQIAADHSDILLTYITVARDLCVRIQRERYLTEHLLEPAIPAGLEITNFGMHTLNRVQWRLQKRKEI